MAQTPEGRYCRLKMSGADSLYNVFEDTTNKDLHSFIMRTKNRDDPVVEPTARLEVSLGKKNDTATQEFFVYPNDSLLDPAIFKFDGKVYFVILNAWGGK